MATKAGVLSATTLGGVTLGGVVGGVVGIPPGLTQTLSVFGAVLGMAAGALTGIIALSVGWAGAPDRIDLRVGDLVNGWRVVRTVTAQGATGPIQLVRRNRQFGVLKSIHQHDKRLGTRHRRLLEEAKAVEAVESAYVARLLDSGEVDDRSFLVYQYAGDHSLNEAAATKHSQSPSEANRPDRRVWGIALFGYRSEGRPPRPIGSPRRNPTQRGRSMGLGSPPRPRDGSIQPRTHGDYHKADAHLGLRPSRAASPQLQSPPRIRCVPMGGVRPNGCNGQAALFPDQPRGSAASDRRRTS